MQKIVLSFAIAVVATSAAWAQTAPQQKPAQPDLNQLDKKKVGKLINAEARAINEDGKSGVRLRVKKRVAQGSNVGLSVLEGVAFTEGTIEVDLKGQNKPQGSFLGLAFNVVDGKTFEAVYFRPFNFKAADEAQRERAVQYIAWPDHTWERLRKEKPGVYEHHLTREVDPDGWFRARLDITAKNINVYVNDAKEPTLKVERLVAQRQGRVALFIDVAEGAFANLKITPAK